MNNLIFPYLKRIELSEFEIKKRKKAMIERMEEEEKNRILKEEKKKKEMEEKKQNLQMLQSFYPWESDYGKKLPKLKRLKEELNVSSKPWYSLFDSSSYDANKLSNTIRSDPLIRFNTKFTISELLRDFRSNPNAHKYKEELDEQIRVKKMLEQKAKDDEKKLEEKMYQYYMFDTLNKDRIKSSLKVKSKSHFDISQPLRLEDDLNQDETFFPWNSLEFGKRTPTPSNRISSDVTINYSTLSKSTSKLPSLENEKCDLYWPFNTNTKTFYTKKEPKQLSDEEMKAKKAKHLYLEALKNDIAAKNEENQKIKEELNKIESLDLATIIENAKVGKPKRNLETGILLRNPRVYSDCVLYKYDIRKSTIKN